MSGSEGKADPEDPPAGTDRLRKLQARWEQHGREDPMRAILSEPGTSGGRWDGTQFFATGRTEIEACMAHLARVGAEPTRDRALDFGCGLGRLTQALAEHFARVDGVDVSQSMIEQARSLNRHGGACVYHVNPRPDLSTFEADSFDFIYSSRVLQHVGRDLARRYVREFARVLRPQGVLLFQLPTHPAWNAAGLVVRLTPNMVLDRVRGMKMEGISQTAVVKLLEGLGLRVLDASPDEAAGRRWESRRYTAVKAA